MSESDSSANFPAVEGERPTLHEGDPVALLRKVLSAAPVFILGADADLRVRFINRIAPGLTRESTIGRSLFDFVDEEHREVARHAVEHVLRTGEEASYETQVTRANGDIIYYQVQIAPTHDLSSDTALIAVASDVSLLRRREEALAESEEQLRLAIDATGMAIWSWDLKLTTPHWSPQMHALTGSTQPLSGRDYVDRIVHPDDRERVWAAVQADVAEGRLDPKPYRILRPDGEVRWVMPVGRFVRDQRGEPVRVVGGLLDITHQVSLEEHLRHSQQMEAVGQLAAGIAHNFNNMLAAILPVLAMSRPFMPPSRVSLVDEAMQAGTRGAEMVQQLLAFARTPSDAGSRRPESIESCVKRALGVCEPAFGRRLTLSAHLEAEGARVLCDPRQIEQALVNVLLNARDAVLDARRESPRIEVEVTRAPAEDVALTGAGKGHPFVRIRVRDNGTGMTAAVRPRIFEPFFTTKGPGRGTGLGLATAFATASELGGLLRCTSSGPEGSVFDFLLPVTESAQETPSPSTKEQHAPDTVLVVDDEPGVREVTALLLEDSGYRVLRAASAEQAMKLAREHTEIRLVLLDLGMPKAGGMSILNPLRSTLSNVRLVGFTGLPPSDGDSALLDGIVLKPVKAGELLEQVARLLAR